MEKELFEEMFEWLGKEAERYIIASDEYESPSKDYVYGKAMGLRQAQMYIRKILEEME